MKQSLLFNKTRKNISTNVEAISHKFLVKGDFIERTISGVYRFLPLGWKVFRKMEAMVREEMEKLGAQEVFLPSFQNKELWEETGRWEDYGEELFKLKDVHDKEIALGPTHEEEITDMVRKRISSYKSLPFSLFQIQNKFRNELRSTGGLLRTREFMMKDLYSFHANEDNLMDFYKRVKESYLKIFDKCDLDIVPVFADTGTIGGDYSHEFMLVNEIGEDTILLCDKCGYGANIEKIGETEECPECGSKLKRKKSIELAHAFRLGTKYSKAMDATYTDENGEEHFILMGCYGLGFARLMASVVEVHHDKNGIIWPEAIAPYNVHLIGLFSNENVKKQADKIYEELKENGVEVLYDDRKNKSAGEKFADSDLLGIPNRIVVSERNLKENSIGFKKREEEKEKMVKIKQISKYLEK